MDFSMHFCPDMGCFIQSSGKTDGKIISAVG